MTNKLEKRIEELEEKLDALTNKDYCKHCATSITEEKQLYPSEDNLGFRIISEKGAFKSSPRGSVVKTRNLFDAELQFELNNWFPTREEAEIELEKRKAIARVKKYIIDNDMYFEPDWINNEECKHIINYYHGDNELYYDFYTDQKSYSPIGYLKSSKDCEQLIKDCKDDLETIYK